MSADPDAVLAALLELFCVSTFEAADPDVFDVTFAGDFRCDRAEPAADLADLLAFGFLRTFDAADAARFPVTSLFLAMS